MKRNIDRELFKMALEAPDEVEAFLLAYHSLDPPTRSACLRRLNSTQTHERGIRAAFTLMVEALVDAGAAHDCDVWREDNGRCRLCRRAS